MAKNTDLNIRIKGDSSSYTSQVFKATAANDALHKSVNGVSKGLIAINGPLDGVAGRFEALRGIMTSGAAAWVGFGAAVTGASAVLLSSIRTYDKYEQQQLKVQQLLETTGYAAGLSAQELQRNAEKVALGTLASVEGIQEAQGALLTFKSVQGDTFLEAIGLAQDMAAVFGGTAKDKALQLGKALQDPLQGINALKRSGVSFSESQRDMIRTMVEAGDKAGAQRVILEELAGQVAGSAGAQAKGLAGSVDTLGQRWDELQVKLAATGPAEKATEWIGKLAEAFHQLGEEIEPSVEGLETKLAVLQARLNKGFNGRSGKVQKSAVLAEIEAINDQLEIARARSGDLDAVASLIEQTQSRIADLESQKPTSGGGRSGNAKNAARQQELAAEKAFLKELQGIRDDAAAVAAKAEETQAKLEADAKAEQKEKEAKALAEEKSKAEDSLKRLRKSLADKKEIELQAYVDRQQAIFDIQNAGVLTEEESRELYLQSYEEYQKRLTEIQKTELDKQVADAKAADDAVAQSKRDLVSAAASANDGLISVLESANKKQSGLYKAALAVQKASQFAMALASANTAAEGVRAREAPVMGFQANTAAEITRGLGYAGAASILGVQIAGAFENGGIVPGTSYTGDNLMARVNSSEMILNRSQQAELFGIANGKGSAGSGSNTTVQVINASSNSAIKEQQSTGPDGQTIKQFVIADLDADEEITQRLMSKFRLNPYGS